MNQKEIGEFIAEMRKEKHLTQAELGERLGVTNKTISRWENGSYMPDISLIQLLCKELKISINELLSGKRLNDEDFRKNADINMISALNRQKLILKEKKISDFFGGAGTGLLISALYSPNSIRRTAIIIIGISMICVGWYCRAKLDKHILEKSQSLADE